MMGEIKTPDSPCTESRITALLEAELASLKAEDRKKVIQAYMLEPQATVIKWLKRIRQEHGFGPCRCKACQSEQGKHCASLTRCTLPEGNHFGETSIGMALCCL